MAIESSYLLWVAIFGFVAAIILVLFFKRPKSKEQKLGDNIDEILNKEKYFENVIDRDTLQNLLSQRKLSNAQVERISELADAIEKGDRSKVYPLVENLKHITKEGEAYSVKTREDIIKEIKGMLKVEAEVALLSEKGHDISNVIMQIRGKIIKKREELKLEELEGKLQHQIVGELSLYQEKIINERRLKPMEAKEIEDLIIRAEKIVNKTIVKERVAEGRYNWMVST